jgi:hypothetical protein
MPQRSDEFARLEQGQYTMLLSENTEEAVYFALPDQDDYLYEYEGDLDEALDALPEIYGVTGIRFEAMSPQAVAMIEQLWDYFDTSGEQELEGRQEYNFQVQDDRLLVLPKDNSGEVVAIARDGQIESTFQPERYEHLMEQFAIAYQQAYTLEYQQDNNRELEPG